MKLGILKTDVVRPELAPDFGEYPQMFINLLQRSDPAIESASMMWSSVSTRSTLMRSMRI